MRREVPCLCPLSSCAGLGRRFLNWQGQDLTKFNASVVDSNNEPSTHLGTAVQESTTVPTFVKLPMQPAKYPWLCCCAPYWHHARASGTSLMSQVSKCLSCNHYQLFVSLWYIFSSIFQILFAFLAGTNVKTGHKILTMRTRPTSWCLICQ